MCVFNVSVHRIILYAVSQYWCYLTVLGICIYIYSACAFNWNVKKREKHKHYSNDNIMQNNTLLYYVFCYTIYSNDTITVTYRLLIL